MDGFDFPATQVCERQEDVDLSQSFAGTPGVKKKPIGVLIVNKTEHPIHIGITSIGRHSSNSIVIKDSSISKYHAEIEGRRKRTFITDLKSLNGTYECKEKFLPNKAYELVDGTSLKFGSVNATFKKTNLDGSLMKTPAVPRSSKIIASTPESILNSTNDDSSVVYGTQDAQLCKKIDSSGVHDLETSDKIFEEPTQPFATKSPCVRKSITPKNLLKEYSKVHGISTDEEGIFDKTTQHFENSDRIHEQDTLKISSLSVNEIDNSKIRNSDRGEQSTEKVLTESSIIHEVETQAFLKNPIETENLPKISEIQDSEVNADELFSDFFDNSAPSSSKKVDEEPTQAFAAKKKNKFLNDPNIVPDSDSDDDIFSQPVPDASTKFDRIHDVETQKIQSPTISKSVKPKILDVKNLRVEDSDTDEEGVFDAETEKVCQKDIGSTTSINVPQETTQLSEVENPKLTLKKKLKNAEDSDTDEDGIFEEPTQEFSSKVDKIHEEKTQTFISPSARPKKSQKLRSKVEDSDANRVFTETMQKTSSKDDKIHEEETQEFLPPTVKPKKTQTEGPDTGEGEAFDGPTQKIATKSEQIYEEKTQALIDSKKPHSDTNEEVSEKPTQEISVATNKIHEEKTQTFLNHKSDAEDSDTDEEGIFENPVQELSSKVANVHEEKTQMFVKSSAEPKKSQNAGSKVEDSDKVFEEPTQEISTSDKIHEKKTQVFLSHKSGEKDSDTGDNGIFDGPTQKISTEVDQTHKLETQAVTCHDPQKEDSDTDEEGVFQEPVQKISTKSDKIHEVETQAFKVPVVAGSSKQISNSEGSNSVEEKMFSAPTQKYVASPERNVEEVLEGPTQKISTNAEAVQEKKTQAFSTNKSENEDYNTNEEGVFEECKQKVSKTSEKIHEEKTQAFIDSKKAHYSINGEDFEGPTQKICTAADEVHEKEIQAFLSHKSEKEDSDTDEEGIFEGPTQKLSTSTNETRKDAETNEEGNFEGPTQKIPSSDRPHEAETQAFQFKSREAGKSEKVSQAVVAKEVEFLGPTQKFTEFSKKNCGEAPEPIVVEKVNSSSKKMSEDPNVVPDSETDDEGVFGDEAEKSGINFANSSKANEEIDFEGSTLIYTSMLEKSLQINTENIAEGEVQSESLNPITRANLSTLDNFSGFTPRGRLKSPVIQGKVGNILLQCESNSKIKKDIESKSIASKGHANLSSEIKPQTDLESESISESETSKSKINLRIAASKSSKIPENLDADVENKKDPKILKPNSRIKSQTNLESKNTSESKSHSESESDSKSEINLRNAAKKNSKIPKNSDTVVENEAKGRRISKRQLEKSEPSTSKKQDSDDKDSVKENSSLRGRKRRGPVPKSSEPKEKDSKIEDKLQTDDSANRKVDQGKVSKKQEEKFFSKDTEKNCATDENVSQEKDSSSEKQTSKSIDQKYEEVNKPSTNVAFKDSEKCKSSDKVSKAPNKLTKSNKLKKSSKEAEKPGLDDSDSAEKPIPSSLCSDLDTKYASVENFEYETASTQPIDDIDDNKSPEIKTYRGGKRSSLNISFKTPNKTPGRKSVRLNDTIENNLNEMFGGASEDAEEPAHMLTQQLKNILEDSQMSEEASQTPSSSGGRNSHKIEVSQLKNSPSVSERSFQSQKSPQVGKLHFKPCCDFQVISKTDEKTCKSSDESDDDFVPFMPKKVELNSMISSNFKAFSNLRNVLNSKSSLSLKENSSSKSPLNLKKNSSSIGDLKTGSRDESPSTSSETSFDDSPLQLSPSLSSSSYQKRSLKRNKIRSRKMVLKSIENIGMHEEVEKHADSQHFIESSDDSDFEDLKRIANRVLDVKSVYVKNIKSAIESKTLKILLERVNVESHSNFQVSVDNASPRMSKLNIIRTKRNSTDKKVESPTIKENKHNDEQTDLEMPLKKRPIRSIDDKEPGTSNHSRKKRLKSNENDGVNSSTANETVNEPKKRGKKKKETNVPPVEKKSQKTTKRVASNLNSMTEDSSASNIEDTLNLNSEIKVPSVPKRTRTRKINVEDKNDESENESKEKVVNTRKGRRRQVIQDKNIIAETSSSSSNETFLSAKEIKEPNVEKKEEKEKESKEEVVNTRKGRRGQVNQNKNIVADTSSSSSNETFLLAKKIKEPNVEKKEEVVNTRKGRRGQATQSKNVTINSSSSSLNETFSSTAKKVKEPNLENKKEERENETKKELINTRKGRKGQTTQRKNIIVNSSSSSLKEMPLLSAEKPDAKNKKEKSENESEEEVVNTRIVKKRQVNQNKNTGNNSSSSLVEKSLNETSSSAAEIIEIPKKTRGRKKKIDNAESSGAENVSASFLAISMRESVLDSSTVSTPSRSKRSRNSSPVKHKVLFTGIVLKDCQKILTYLGLNSTEDVNKCTILVTDKIRRTFKFLCGVSQGVPIVSVDWITDSRKKSEIQEWEQYLINDPSTETKFKFKLSESLEKARNKKMLAGYTIILTPNLTAPPTAELKDMVIASGGKALLRPPAKWPENSIVVSDEKDLDNAKKFMVKAPKAVTLHSTEFLLTGILKQEVDLKSYVLSIK